MGKGTKIEWCDNTANFWTGCVEVSPGCDNCYARELTRRFHPDTEYWGVHAPRLIHAGTEKNVMAWQRAAEKAGVRKRIFCQSMSDIGESVHHNHPQRRELQHLQDHIFLNIIPATPNLDWLLLTKRIGNMQRVAPYDWQNGNWPANVWMGISVVNQEEAARDIPKLLALPAPVRFLSVEPCLEHVNLVEILLQHKFAWMDGKPMSAMVDMPWIDWCIIGGESGTGARPCNLSWIRSLVQQCKAADVACFVKQFGSNPFDGDDMFRAYRVNTTGKGGNMEEWPADLRVREFPVVRGVK